MPLVTNTLASIYGSILRAQRYGLWFRRLFRFLMWTWEWPQQRLQGLAEAQLRWLLRWCWNTVPFYRRLWNAAGVNPLRGEPFDVLAKLPAITKRDVQANWQDMISLPYRRQRLIKGETSGTTGTGLKLLWAPVALAWEFATVWRLRRLVGVRRSMLKATFNGRPIISPARRKPPFWVRNIADRQVLFSAFHMSPDCLPHYTAKLRTFRNWYTQGYPSLHHLVAQQLLRESPLEHPPKALFVSSETLLEHQRRDIERAFRARAWDRYGVSEFCVSMIECERGNLHLDIEMGVVEIDPVLDETDEWVRGELICTSWANPAMPFVRYRISDTAVMLKKPCGCGRESPAFRRIEGRVEDYLITPEGNLIGRLDHVFKGITSVAEAQLYQESPDEVVVRFVPRSSFNDHDKAKIIRLLRERIGGKMRIRFEQMAQIPRLPNGKFRFVVSMAAQDYLKT